MADTKISAGADPGTVVATDKVPMARSASTTAYAATMAELAVFANTAYVPNYSGSTPAMDGVGAPGVAATVSRGDHKHPTDTALLSRGGGTMTGTLVLAADPAAPLQAATKQYVDGSAPAGGPYVSIANMHDVGRNLLHNPLFAVAQRGAGPFTSGTTADRWTISSGTDAVSYLITALGDADRVAVGDEAAVIALPNVFTGNAAAGAYNFLYQRIERVLRLSGKTVTLSFWARATAGTPKLGLNMSQNFGTGGSPSAQVVALATGNAVTLSTAWTRYTSTIALPSASGKTLGTAGDDNTQLEFWYSSGATLAARSGNIGVQSGTIWLWGVQLEVGSVATPLEKPDPQQDLARCQRFYQTGGILGAGTSTAAVQIYHMATLPVQMRAGPAIVPTNSSTNITAPNVVAIGSWPTGAVAGTGTATATGAYVMNIAWTASADL